MSKTEVDSYLNCLQQSGLVPKDQLSQMLSKIIREAAGRKVDSAYLAECFQDAGLVTAWHNEKLLKGRYKGFFLGSYKLLGHIATGGMSNIYYAEHQQMRRRVAIKVLPPSLTNNTSHLERFYVESQVIASLDHPNIVKAYDISSQGNFHYMVLEYVDGPDLKTKVLRDGVLEFHKAADYIRQAADGLQHAHEKSIIHRDVKPANLLADPDGIIKVLDLGLTRVVDAEGPSLTLQHGEKLIGTIDYISPEQAVNSHDVDARADIYSLGCTLYFLLAGHPPYPEGSQTERLMAHQTKAPEPISQKREDAPKDLLAILDKMIAKKQKHRYQTAAEVSDVLTKWLTVNGFSPTVVKAQSMTDSAPMGAQAGEIGEIDSELAIELTRQREILADQAEGSSQSSGTGSEPSNVLAKTSGSSIARREAYLDQRLRDLADREHKLEAREKLLEQRSIELDTTAQKLNELEAYLESKAREIEYGPGDSAAQPPGHSSSQADLDEIEDKLLELKEQQSRLDMVRNDLGRRQRALKQREEDLQSWEQDLETLQKELFSQRERNQKVREELKQQRAYIHQKEEELGLLDSSPNDNAAPDFPADNGNPETAMRDSSQS